VKSSTIFMGRDLLLVPIGTIFLIDEDNRLVHDPTSPFEHPIRLSQPQAFISSERLDSSYYDGH